MRQVPLHGFYLYQGVKRQSVRRIEGMQRIVHIKIEVVILKGDGLSWKRNTCSLSHQWEFVAFSLLRQCHEQLLSESTGLSPAFWNCFKIDLYLENVRENYFNSIKRDVFFTLVKFPCFPRNRKMTTKVTILKYKNTRFHFIFKWSISVEANYAH